MNSPFGVLEALRQQRPERQRDRQHQPARPAARRRARITQASRETRCAIAGSEAAVGDAHGAQPFANSAQRFRRQRDGELLALRRRRDRASGWRRNRPGSRRRARPRARAARGRTSRGNRAARRASRSGSASRRRCCARALPPAAARCAPRRRAGSRSTLVAGKLDRAEAQRGRARSPRRRGTSWCRRSRRRRRSSGLR